MLRFGGSTPGGGFSYFVGAKTGTTDIQFEAPSPTAQTLITVASPLISSFAFRGSRTMTRSDSPWDTKVHYLASPKARKILPPEFGRIW